MNTQNKIFLGNNSKVLFEFDYTNCVDIIQSWLSIKSIISVFYKIFLYFMFTVFVLSSIFLFSFKLVVIQVGIGIVYFIISIGIHQFLHIFAARIMGCSNTKFIVPKASVFCYCDQKILNSKQYRFISMFPFIIITLISFVLIAFKPHYISSIAVFNLLYTIFCNGDIAITNYFYKNPDAYFYCEQVKNKAYLFKKL